MTDKMKKTFVFIATLVLLMILVSCRKPISLNQREGDGVIVSHYHTSAYTTTTIVPCGKVLIPMSVSHPATYGVTIKCSYNDYTYSTDYQSSQLFAKPKGTKVRLTWTEKVYKNKDGTTDTKISNVEVVNIYK